MRITGALGAGLIPFLLWLPELHTQMTNDRYNWIKGFNPPRVLQTPLRLFTPLVSGRWTNLAALAVVVVCAYGAAALCRRGPAGRLCASLSLVPLALAALAWAAGERIFATRNMIAIGPFVAVCVVSALVALPRPVRAGAALVLSAAILGGFAWDQQKPDFSYSSVAHDLVAEGWRAGDPVAVYGAFTAFHSPLEWYLPRHTSLHRLRSRRLGDGVLFVVSARRTALALHGRDRRVVDGLIVERLLDAGPRIRARILRTANILSSRV